MLLWTFLNFSLLFFQAKQMNPKIGSYMPSALVFGMAYLVQVIISVFICGFLHSGIQATEKYSNSNVLICHPPTFDSTISQKISLSEWPRPFIPSNAPAANVQTHPPPTHPTPPHLAWSWMQMQTHQPHQDIWELFCTRSSRLCGLPVKLSDISRNFIGQSDCRPIRTLTWPESVDQDIWF